MGTFTVEMTVSPVDFSVSERVTALVNTGATYSMIPASRLRQLGIEPYETVEFELPDGKIAEYQTGWAGFAATGRRGLARVIFGPEDEYILGMTTLEDLGLKVDPVNYRLAPTRRLLKPLRRQAATGLLSPPAQCHRPA